MRAAVVRRAAISFECPARPRCRRDKCRPAGWQAVDAFREEDRDVMKTLAENSNPSMAAAMGRLRRRSFICCQACVFHISAWRPTPMTVTSFPACMLAQVGGQQDAPLLVRRRLHGGGGYESARHGDFTMLFSDRVRKCAPICLPETPPDSRQPAGDDESRPWPRGIWAGNEPSLVIDGIAVLADQHFQPPPSRHMGSFHFTHFAPLLFQL